MLNFLCSHIGADNIQNKLTYVLMLNYVHAWHKNLDAYIYKIVLKHMDVK